MPIAVNLLRSDLHYRRDAFDAGFQRLGFTLAPTLAKPRPGDVLCIWNRYGGPAEVADHFERAGARVIVVENCPLGNSWASGRWVSLARNNVAVTGGEIRYGGPERWDAWKSILLPWWNKGHEVIILGQRGIGRPGVASPPKWEETARRRFGGRIRRHPGNGAPQGATLYDDLADASCVVTWSSAAALLALALGVPVWHEHPKFVGALAARNTSSWPGEPKRDDAARLEVFRRLAWAMWEIEDVRNGEALAWML